MPVLSRPFKRAFSCYTTFDAKPPEDVATLLFCNIVHFRGVPDWENISTLLKWIMALFSFLEEYDASGIVKSDGFLLSLTIVPTIPPFCYFCFRMGASKLSITRTWRESNDMEKMGIVNYVTLQSLFVCFTSKILETWYPLLFNFFNILVKQTQSGLPRTQNMIGFWPKCGSATLTTKCIRFV